MSFSELFHQHRPQYHFLPPKNWMNDPNGLIHINGEYHLFYQHNPLCADWGKANWGHAVSTDLVHWKHLPMALCPDQPYDKDGVFSGCAVNHDGQAKIFYTGVQPEVQCLATTKDMIHWDKSPANPLIDHSPEGLNVKAFRDPSIWREGEDWLMIIGSGIADVGGAVLLYRSKDLISWEYLHSLCCGKKEETGDVWECPSFFKLGEKWVLMVSPLPLMRTIYFVGEYKDRRFIPEFRGEIDLGGVFYAPHCFCDELGRRIMMAWILESRSLDAYKKAGWAGVHSLPRTLSLASDNKTLLYEMIDELKSLRDEHLSFMDLKINSSSKHIIDSVQFEAIIEFGEISAKSFGLDVRKSPDGSEVTRIIYNAENQTLSIDRSKSSESEDDLHDIRTSPMVLAQGESLSLHVFVDNSILEVHANNRVSMISRVYPGRDDSVGVELFADNGSVNISAVDLWRLKSIWAD